MEPVDVGRAPQISYDTVYRIVNLDCFIQLKAVFDSVVARYMQSCLPHCLVSTYFVGTNQICVCFHHARRYLIVVSLLVPYIHYRSNHLWALGSQLSHQS